MPDSVYPVRDYLDRQDAARLKRDNHELRVENRKLRERLETARYILLVWCDWTTTRLFERGWIEVGVGVATSEQLDRAG